MELDNTIFYLAGGGFLLFVLVMAFGAQVLPTGNLLRQPTPKGDVAIALFALALIVFLTWAIFGGWKYAFGVAPPKTPEIPLAAPVAVQGVTHIFYLQPDAIQKPALLKRQLRRYCDDYLQTQPKDMGQCVVFAWLDNRFLPRAFPIPASSLPQMSANYVFNRVGDVDRFCWLERGRVVEANCF
jgi:hypothetical protein